MCYNKEALQHNYSYIAKRLSQPKISQKTTNNCSHTKTTSTISA